MLRFSIRDVLWLTALVAVLAAWWIDDRRLRQSVSDANDKADALFLELTRISPPPTVPLDRR
jgi:hypothetical protein